MRRDEALFFLKEILDENPYMSPEGITLNHSKDCRDYTVNIKEIFSSQTIRDIARKHNFSVKEEKGATVIYTPDT